MIDFATAYPNSRKVHESRPVPLSPGGSVTDVQVPMREVTLGGGEAPVRLYDTSGPSGHDVRDGLPKLRQAVDRRQAQHRTCWHAALLRAPRGDHARDGVCLGA